MGSTRLPGKVLKPLAGQSVLWHVVNRLRYAKTLEEIVVATTTESEDNVIEEFCRAEKIHFYRGSKNDVLDRYYHAAKTFQADPIVRITADCPLIDPLIVDEVVNSYFKGGYEACGLAGEFPDGLDCEVFSFRAIEDAWRHSVLPSEREHVGPYIYKHPEKYLSGAHHKFQGLKHHRWCLDEERDYHFLEVVFERLYEPHKLFLTLDILNLLVREPYLMEINTGIVRNEGYLKSLAEDKDYLQNK